MQGQSHPITQETRQASFDEMIDSKAKKQQAVLGALRGHDRGLTAEEVASMLGWETYRTRPRLSELLVAGKVHVIGKRWNASTERNIAVWVAA